MPVLPKRKYRPQSYHNTFAAKYRAQMGKRPFLLFGLPFITTVVAGSFFLTPATALRYERHDRKVKQLSKEEELGLKKEQRKAFDINEEYYRLAAKVSSKLLNSCIGNGAQGLISFVVGSGQLGQQADQKAQGRDGRCPRMKIWNQILSLCGGHSA